MPDNNGFIQLDLPNMEQSKEVDSSVLNQSVQEFPNPLEGAYSRSAFFTPLLYTMNVADTVTQWNPNPAVRDAELRMFWPTEPLIASAVYAATSRIASFKWKIKAADPTKPKPERTIRRITRILNDSHYGRGWHFLISKTLVDLYTQDNGAYFLYIRSELDNPSAPVINIAHLDSAQCERTGNPLEPVIYTDMNGKRHLLKWYQVEHLAEMPMPVEEAYDTQLCAVSRALLASQILRDISVYKLEKVSGKFTRAIHFVSGVGRNEMNDALMWSQEQTKNLGAYRYMQPVVIPGLDPNNPVSVATIPLASLPDAFDEESTMKWYIAQLALAFGVDYQEFAPLPGGSLGSSQQSSILHQKTQGKGPALIMSLIEHIMNDSGILPNTVMFEFEEHDLSGEKDRAEAAFTRGKDRNLRIYSGELDPQAARELAVLNGDLPEYMVDQIEERGVAQSQVIEGSGQTLGAEQIVGGSESHLE